MLIKKISNVFDDQKSGGWARCRRHLFRSHAPNFVTVNALHVFQLVVVRLC